MLEKIFISYHFDPKAIELATYIGDLVRGFDIKTEVGENVAGGTLTDVIKKKIESSDAMIFLLTKRGPNQNNDWVMAEVSHAQSVGVRTIGILEDGLGWPAPLVGQEYIPFQSIDSGKFWIKLSSSINIWKREMGRSIQAALLPQEFTEQFRDQLHALTASYQMIDNRFRKTEWIPCRIGETLGGIGVFLEGVQEHKKIKLKINNNQRIWQSPPISQELQIKLQ